MACRLFGAKLLTERKQYQITVNWIRNFSDILIKAEHFSFKKFHFKMSCAKKVLY